MSQKEADRSVAPNSDEPWPEDLDIDIEPPAYDKVTEGYDPSKVEANSSEDEQKA